MADKAKLLYSDYPESEGYTVDVVVIRTWSEGECIGEIGKGVRLGPALLRSATPVKLAFVHPSLTIHPITPKSTIRNKSKLPYKIL